MIGIQIHRYRIKSWEEKPHTKNPLAAERDIEKKNPTNTRIQNKSRKSSSFSLISRGLLF